MQYNNEVFGYMNKSGKFVIEPQFESACEFLDGFAWVEYEGKWGMINEYGAYVIKPTYDAIGARTRFGTWVKMNKEWRLIDHYGHFITDQRYDFDSMEEYQEGLTAITIYEKVGFMDEVGNITIRPQFESVLDGFSEGLAAVRLYPEDTWYFINKKGEPVISGEYISVKSFSEGLACVQVDELWGYIDQKGEYIIEPQFQEAHSFSEGLACVKLNNKYGYINNRGNWLIEPNYDKAYDFQQGYATIMMGKKAGIIDHCGKLIIKPFFDAIHFFKEDVAVVEISNKYGVIDRQGQQIIPCELSLALGFSDGLMNVAINKEDVQLNSISEEQDKKEQLGTIETTDISFGHILVRKGYEKQLENIVSSFLEGEDCFLSRGQGKGVLSILIKSYTQEMGLLEIQSICEQICQYLDEETQIEIATDYEENKILEDYFGLTLIRK